MGYFKNIVIGMVEDFHNLKTIDEIADKYNENIEDIRDIVLEYYSGICNE